MSGGGSRGAFEPGALLQLAKHFDGTQEMEYDVISGVSVGAINAGMFSLFPKGNEIDAAKYMYNCWLELSNE